MGGQWVCYGEHGILLWRAKGMLWRAWDFAMAGKGVCYGEQGVLLWRAKGFVGVI